MTDAKHTPGPWEADISEDGAFTIDAFDGNTRILCSRAPWPHYAEASCANARLIAAAPELLEALIEAREHIAWSAPDWHIRTREMLATIDAAIAKARGQA